MAVVPWLPWPVVPVPFMIIFMLIFMFMYSMYMYVGSMSRTRRVGGGGMIAHKATRNGQKGTPQNSGFCS
jgi:hypothetical protein